MAERVAVPALPPQPPLHVLDGSLMRRATSGGEKEIIALGLALFSALSQRLETRLARATPQDRQFILEAVGAQIMAP